MSLGKESGEATVERLNAPDSGLSETDSDTNIKLALTNKGLAEFETIDFIRDIKPQSFIMEQDGRAHWIDFGTSRNEESSSDNEIDLNDLMIGTPMYIRDVTIFE